jgi:eukaryotic-like serine/threonine-protein kinase
MAAPPTAPAFLETVSKSGLLEEKQLEEYLDTAQRRRPLPEAPVELAKRLVRDGLLTRFQASHLLQGKWMGFRIGPYTVLERLGAGDAGNVYLCEHAQLRRRVAVKVLRAAQKDDPIVLERFYREARAAAALNHPNLVRAYDVGEEKDMHYLVMEFVDGGILEDIVKKHGPLSFERAANYLRQAADGLQHAHEARLVHRDLKPGNLLVDRAGVVKILDLGLALSRTDRGDPLTVGYVLGSEDYMAPEQALDSHAVDIRSDIYSLGATFYFCLTGQRPFAGATIAERLGVRQRPYKPLRECRADVPEEFAHLLDRMMAPDPERRFATPADVSEALLPWTDTPIDPPPEEEMPHLCPAAQGIDWTESKTPVPAPTPKFEIAPPTLEFAAPAIEDQRAESQSDKIDFKPTPKSDPSLNVQLASLMKQLSGPARAVSHDSESVPEIWSNTPAWVKAVAVAGLAAAFLIVVLWWAV